MLKIQILKKGDQVLNVTPEFIVVQRKNGEVDILPLIKDETGLSVRRHIVGGANCTLFSVNLPPRLCRTGTCRRLQTE